MGNAATLAARPGRNTAGVPITRPVHVPSSSRLFQLWAQRRKDVFALEDRLAAAEAGSADAAALREQLQQARADADRLVAQALDAFHAEMRERGLE